VRTLLAIVVCSFPALAGEYAVLSTGFRIHAERHETAGDVVRLHTATGTMEFPAAQITAFEREEYVKPADPAPPAAAPAPAPPATALTPQQLVDAAALKHGLRPEFVRSVAAAESAFRANAVSPKGALGLMQLMPGTAADLGVNPKDPAQNAHGGALYLRQLLDKYKGKPDAVRLALAAYNAGPGAVQKYGAVPPYRETQQYVNRVVDKYLKAVKAGSD
jgi:soluble lytic murein transglycosylase-like protein